MKLKLIIVFLASIVIVILGFLVLCKENIYDNGTCLKQTSEKKLSSGEEIGKGSIK